MDDDWSHLALIFAPLADDVPAGVRFRRLLRYALRVCRLRCVRMEEVEEAVDAGNEAVQQQISEAFKASKKGAGEPSDWRSLIFGDSTHADPQAPSPNQASAPQAAPAAGAETADVVDERTAVRPERSE